MKASEKYKLKNLKRAICIYIAIGILLFAFFKDFSQFKFINFDILSVQMLEEYFLSFMVLLSTLALLYFYLGVKSKKIFIFAMLWVFYLGYRITDVIFIININSEKSYQLIKLFEYKPNLVVYIITLISLIYIYNMKDKNYEISIKTLLIYSIVAFLCGVLASLGIIQILTVCYESIYSNFVKYNFFIISIILISIFLIIKQCIGKHSLFLRYILGVSFLALYKQIFIVIGLINNNSLFIINLLHMIMFAMPIIGIFNQFIIKLRLSEAKGSEVKNLEIRIKEITDNMEDAMFVIDKNLKINYVTPSYCKLFGGTQEELIGSSPFDCIHKDYREIVRKNIKKSMEEKQVFFGEYKAVDKHGKNIWVETLMNVIYEDNKVVGAVVNRRNITRRKKIEEKLKVSEKKYRNFFNMCSDFTYIMEVSPKKRLIDINPAMLDALQVTLREFQEKDIKDFRYEEDKELHNEIMEKLRKGERVIAEFSVKSKDGERIDIEANYVPIFKDNKLKMILFIGRNLNVNKKIKELRLQNKKSKAELIEAKEYDKLKTEFFANISHELKTPVNVIFSAIQLIKIKAENKYIDYYVDSVKNNCYRLIRLISNIIDLTKLEAGFFYSEFRYENIIEVVEDLTMSVVPYTQMRGLELIFDTDVEELKMYVDRKHIERIILNLISNSIKFTSSGGKIFVNLEKAENGLRIKVQDTGIGISQEDQEIIFQRFRQVDKSFCRTQEGSGIGLSLVKSLVELYGGDIKISSELGKGSKFTVFIPSIEPTEEQIKDNANLNENNTEKISIELSDIY